MAKKSANDVIWAEVHSIEERISVDNTSLEDMKLRSRLLQKQIDEFNQEVRKLKDQLKEKEKQAETALINLKKYVWESDSPEVIELRNELLLATKLTKD